jgi:hypothetical protein
MISLKSFIPSACPHLGVSPAALYERQRALVRLGVLHGKEGKGRGSGVRLSADAVAALLASLLATDSLSEVADTIPLLNLKPNEGNCPITEATTFWGALTYLLESDPDGAAFPYFIEVRRKKWWAQIGQTMDEVSTFEPWTDAEKRLLAPDPEAYDEDEPFEPSGPGITTMAQYHLGELISAYKAATGKGDMITSPAFESMASE